MPHDVFRLERSRVGRFAYRNLRRHHPCGVDHSSQHRICAGGRAAAGVRPLCGHYSTGDFRPLHQLASCRGKPGCSHFRDSGNGADWICSVRRFAAGGICTGPRVAVRPAVLCVLAFSTGISRQFSIPRRVGRLYHRPGDRGIYQPAQKNPGSRSFN